LLDLFLPGGEIMRKSILFAVYLALIFSLSCSQESRMKTSQNEYHREVDESATPPIWMRSAVAKLENELAATYGEAQSTRIRRGLKQVSEFWRASDGDQAVFEEFVGKNFAGDQRALDTMFERVENLLEQALGHMSAFQLEEHMKRTGRIGPEFKRVARQGRLAPDLWMKAATGSPVWPEALLAAIERALSIVKD
jgi:hypothetical protein